MIENKPYTHENNTKKKNPHFVGIIIGFSVLGVGIILLMVGLFIIGKNLGASIGVIIAGAILAISGSAVAGYASTNAKKYRQTHP